MAQAKEMAQKMEATKARLAEHKVEAVAGAGGVTVIARGDLVVEKVKIDPKIVSPDDVEMIEDLVLVAVRDALEKAKLLQAEEMKKVTGGIAPPNFGV